MDFELFLDRPSPRRYDEILELLRVRHDSRLAVEEVASTKTKEMAMSDRRRFVTGVLVPVFIGLMGAAAFYNMVNNPRFATFQGIDVVRLLAAGMCFGSALTWLLLYFQGRSSG